MSYLILVSNISRKIFKKVWVIQSHICVSLILAHCKKIGLDILAEKFLQIILCKLH